MTTISRIQTTAPTTGVTPTARPKPTLAQMAGTGFTNLRRDHVATARPAGKALTKVSFGDRWKTLDTPEKFFVCMIGSLGTVATVGSAVAGAKGSMGRGGGVKGALVGAGIGVASTVLTALIMDVGFTQGSMVTTKDVAKLLGLKK